MDNRKIRETPNSTDAALLLGAIMVAVGIGMIVMRILQYENEWTIIHLQDGPCGYISRTVVVIGGVLILLFRKRGNYFAVGAYAITLGISRVIRSLPDLLSSSDLRFYSSLAFIVIGVNLVYSGYNHLTVRTKNPFIMKMTAIILLSAYLVGLLYMLCFDVDTTVILSNNTDIIWYLPLYVALIIILSSKDVMENVPMGRIKRYSSLFSQKMNLGGPLTISRSDADKISEALLDDCPWTERSIGSLSIKEDVVSFGTVSGQRDVVVGKVTGKEGIVLSIVDDSRDSFVTGLRFRVTGCVRTDDTLELRDEKGTCAILSIGGME